MGKFFVVKKAGVCFNGFNKPLRIQKFFLLLCVLVNPYLSIVSADTDLNAVVRKPFPWVTIDSWAQTALKPVLKVKAETRVVSVFSSTKKSKCEICEIDDKRILIENYKVRNGDHIWRILKERGLLKEANLPQLMAALKRLNASLTNLNLIRPGFILRIPLIIVSPDGVKDIPVNPPPGAKSTGMNVTPSVNKAGPVYLTQESRSVTTAEPIFYSTPLLFNQDRMAEKRGIPSEADTSLIDTDKDGLIDSLEATGCTDPKDADTDDDGIPDGAEDRNRNGRVDPDETDFCNCDTDGDGIQDGTEIGLALNEAGPDTDLAIFQPDLDPATHTNPLDADSDDDGLGDGQEDGNHNGKVDNEEKDPNVKVLEFNILSGKLTNPYAPYQAGRKYVYSGTGTFKGFSRYQYAEAIEQVDGVNCLRITIKGYGNDPDPEKDPEYYQIWLAEDTSGVVWLLRVHDGYEHKTTTFGVKNAVLWMPNNPVKGQEFKQTANEFSIVKATGVDGPLLSTGLGIYVNCLLVQRSAAGGTDLDILYLAPGTALIKEDWNDNNQTNGWDLNTIEHPAFMSVLVVDFGIRGLYHYNGSNWTRLAQVDVEQLHFYDCKLVVDAGSEHGLQEYVDKTWKQISKWDADNTGNPLVNFRDTLVVDFGTNGLYSYHGTIWSKFTDLDVQYLGTYNDKLVADTGAQYGLWEYDGTEWKQISPLDADNTGNTFTAYQDGLAVDFGTNGLQYYSGTTWIKLADVDAEYLATYGDKLVVDAGSYGLYEYDGKAWKQISALNPDNTGNTFMAFREGLVVDFGVQGVQFYNGQSWTTLVPADVEYLYVYGDKLVVDAGAKYGLYEYDGKSWKQISPLNADNTGNTMIGVDLSKD